MKEKVGVQKTPAFFYEAITVIDVRSNDVIGIFDSGIGGIAILNALLKSSTREFVYVADTAYLPYGNKSKEVLIERGRVVAQLFVDRGISTVVVACHTSSANALPTLKKEFSHINFVDLLEPTVKAAVAATKTKIIGVIATSATIGSGRHRLIAAQQASQVKVIEQACPKLVPLIEATDTPPEALHSALQEYLEPMERNGVDTLILGCTHYEFLKEHIGKLTPQLTIISAMDLVQTGVPVDKPKITFLTSSPADYSKSILRFLNNRRECDILFGTF